MTLEDCALSTQLSLNMKKFVETAGLQELIERCGKLFVTLDKRRVNWLTKQLQHLMYMGTMSSIRLIWGQQARQV